MGAGVIGKEVVEAGGQFKTALVAVFGHALDPARIQQAASDHLVEFLL